MGTRASEQRAARRFYHQFMKELEASPTFQARLRARLRHARRHPYSNATPGYVQHLCIQWGRELGGRPPKARRCTKRLGSRFCWGWRVKGTTRCFRHCREDPLSGEPNKRT